MAVGVIDTCKISHLQVSHSEFMLKVPILSQQQGFQRARGGALSRCPVLRVRADILPFHGIVAHSLQHLDVLLQLLHLRR